MNNKEVKKRRKSLKKDTTLLYGTMIIMVVGFIWAMIHYGPDEGLFLWLCVFIGILATGIIIVFWHKHNKKISEMEINL